MFKVTAVLHQRSKHHYNTPSQAQIDQCRHIAAASVAFAVTVFIPKLLKLEPIPMRTSILTGRCWLDEVFNDHLGRFHEQFGMLRSTFQALSSDLQQHSGLQDSKKC